MGVRNKMENNPTTCERCGGHYFKLSTIWNMGNTNPDKPDFEDVWECRDCGAVYPIEAVPAR